MAQSSSVHPIAPYQFVRFNLQPPRNHPAPALNESTSNAPVLNEPTSNASAWNESTEMPATPQEIDASVDDLPEISSKRFVSQKVSINRLPIINYKLSLDRRIYFLKFYWDCS